MADGLDRVDAGLTQLYDGVGGSPDQAKPLHAGIAKLRAGLGAKGQDGTLIDGVDQFRAGLASATENGGGLDQLKGGVDQSKGGVDQSKGGVDQSKGGVDQVAGLEDALKTGGGIDQLSGGVSLATKADCGPACQAILGQVQGGLTDLRSKTTAASAGLGQVSGGLDAVSAGLGLVSGGLGHVSGGLAQLKGKLSDAAYGLIKVECGLSNTTLSVCDPKVPGLLEGVDLVDAGVSTLVDGVVGKVQGGIGGPKDTAENLTLRGGVNDLQDGVDLLGLGGVDLLDAIDQLTVGADQVHGGTSQVATGAKDLGAGASKLANGSSDLATGAGQLDAGVGTLADGAGQLDDGAAKLEDGAGQLSDGLADAADGTSQLASVWRTTQPRGRHSSRTGLSACPTRGRRSSSRPARRRRRTTARATPSPRSVPGAPRPRAWPTAPPRVRSVRRRTPTSSAGVDGEGPPTPVVRPLRQALRPRGWLGAAEETLPLTAGVGRPRTETGSWPLDVAGARGIPRRARPAQCPVPVMSGMRPHAPHGLAHQRISMLAIS